MSDLKPMNLGIESFQFLEQVHDPATGELRLSYRFDEGTVLEERIVFPYAPWPSDASRQRAFDAAASALHLIAGVSYYKACVPPRMELGDHLLSPPLAQLLQQVYVDGLAEFALAHKLNLRERVNFEPSRAQSPGSAPLGLPDRALVAIGGGKDSLVSLDLLRRAGVEVQPVCVGSSPLIADTVRVAGLPLLQIDRKLSPILGDMNDAGALNGHVPVTAINSAIIVCAAVLYGYKWVVFSNERSAEEATRKTIDLGPVNHQYSKSLAFESTFRRVVQENISPEIEYFSLLRPWSELAVARHFARLKPFHPVFSSCNRNFHLEGTRLGNARWCQDCPKCRSTTLALAPFLSPGEISGFMGADLLNDPAQEQGFRALCGLGEEKPFECVGTIEESRAALVHIAQQDEWCDAALVTLLAPELVDENVRPLQHFMTPSDAHCIPEELQERAGL